MLLSGAARNELQAAPKHHGTKGWTGPSAGSCLCLTFSCQGSKATAGNGLYCVTLLFERALAAGNFSSDALPLLQAGSADIYIYIYGSFLKWGYPQIIHFSYFPSLNHLFWVPSWKTIMYIYIYIPWNSKTYKNVGYEKNTVFPQNPMFSNLQFWWWREKWIESSYSSIFQHSWPQPPTNMWLGNSWWLVSSLLTSG